MFLEFSLALNGAIFINRKHITSIQEQSSGTVIRTVDRKEFLVGERYEDVQHTIMFASQTPNDD